MNYLKSFISWFLGIIFLLFAIIFLLCGIIFSASLNFVFFIACCIITAVLIPPICKYIEKAFGFKLTAIKKDIIILMCIFIPIGFGICSNFAYIMRLTKLYESSKYWGQDIKGTGKEYKINLSEIIKNPSEKDKKAVIEFEKQFLILQDNCGKALYYNHYLNISQIPSPKDLKDLSDAYTESYNKISHLDVPTFLPEHVKNLLSDAKKDYLNAILSILKQINEAKGISNLDIAVRSYIKNINLSGRKLTKVRKIMGIPDKSIYPIYEKSVNKN